MRYQFYTADVFTHRIFGGNPLAVFPYAQKLTSYQMQQIAREFNLSETVFVFPSQTADRRLRIFTPNAEIPFAGHPTIGTAHILGTIGDISLKAETTIIFEEDVGEVPVKIRTQGSKPIYAELTAAQPPEFGPNPPPIEELAAMLSLEPSDLLRGDYQPQAISCGLPYLIIPLRSCEAVQKAHLDRAKWQQLLSSYWASQVYLFAFQEATEAKVKSRMFAPALGIDEDPATGSAATVLASYLGIRDPLYQGTLRWTIEQGVEIGRPSLLQAEADKQDGKLGEIRVGGASILVSEGMMEIPED